jgi:hypothetical protein
MRIISKFQDYYDSALAFGHDEHVVFERKESSIRIDQRTPENSEYHFMIPSLGARSARRRWWGSDPITNRNGFEFAFYPFTVAFCGKLYRGIDIRYQKSGALDEWRSKCFYDLASYIEQLHRYGIAFKDKRSRSYAWDKFPKGSPLCFLEVKEYFSTSAIDHVSFFAERSYPIAVCHHVMSETGMTVAFDTVLKDYKFYKVFDPYTAFQELVMFISGVMTREGNPMAGISDTDLRDKKGFDKMSFKKAPTKKR